MLGFFRREWLMWRAQRRMERNDFFSAIELLKRAAHHSPKYPRLWVLLYHAYSRQGEFQNAEAAIKKALELKPDNPTYHLLLGELYYDTEGFEAARQEFERCLPSQPENQLVQNFLALTLYRLGEKSKALQMFNSYGLTNNKDFLSRFSAFFEKEILDNPELFPEPSAQYEELRSSVFYKLYDFFRNADILRRFFKFLFLRKCFHRATKLLRFSNYRAAMDAFNFILTITPENPDALYGLAIANCEQGNYAEAKEIFLRLVEREKFNPAIIVYLGWCYFRLGKFNTALALFERVSNNRPEDYNANYYAGLCYLALGEKLNAQRSFEKAFKHYFVDTSEQCLNKLVQRVLALPEKPPP